MNTKTIQPIASQSFKIKSKVSLASSSSSQTDTNQRRQNGCISKIRRLSAEEVLKVA